MFFRNARPRTANTPTKRTRTFFCERLEDRTTPHSGVTLFSAGITPDSAPTGIVLGPDNNFWFAEFASSRIARITPTGTVTEFTLPAGRGPVNLAVGPDKNVWFTENSGDRIGRINPLAGTAAAIQGSIVEFVVPGAGSAPNDIVAGPDGAMWFTQSGSDQIGRITVAGSITEFAVPGVGSTPSGITAGSDGALWFTQSGSGEIGRISTAGAVTEFTIPVAGAGFSDPEDITAGPGGALYFTDFGRDQIGRITTAGAITQFNLPVGRGPLGITASSDGDLYFTQAASGRLGRLPASALVPGRPTSGGAPVGRVRFHPRREHARRYYDRRDGRCLVHLESRQCDRQLPGAPRPDHGDRDGNDGQRVRPETVTREPVHAVPRLQRDVQRRRERPQRQRRSRQHYRRGAGGGPHVRVFDGSDNRLVANFFAFDPGFRGGVSLGADDVNGDGRADIIVSAGPGGGPHVKVIDGTKLDQVQANGVIADSALLANFFAFDPASRNGVTLAALDFTADGRNDVIVGSGPGGESRVIVIDAAKLSQLQGNGRIADTALLANFLAFDATFRGGVFVGVGYNDVARKLILGAGAGGGPHVKVVDGTKMTQRQADGVIAPAALLANFFAFDPAFRGGVRVSGDDLNSDGLAELILSAGPGGGPHVKVIDGGRFGQLRADGQIADSALVNGFFSSDPSFTGGVFIAADADHRDGPIAGPPGITITNSQRDINDLFIFQSPVTPTNTVLTMTVSPFSSTGTPAQFVPGLLYDFRVVNRDLTTATDDLVFRVTFGPPDAAANNQQDVVVRALPAARFVGSGGVLVKGFTGKNEPVRGVGGNGTAQFRAAEQDDPFLFDAAAFNRFLNGGGLSDGTPGKAQAGQFPNGTSNNGAGDSNANGLGFDANEPVYDYNAVNFFANANTMAIVLELPSTVLAGLRPGDTLTPDQNAVGLWGRTELHGVQVDRVGRPAINSALIPPVPRGSNFPADGSAPNRTDLRNAFNAGHPRNDAATFTDGMASVLAAVYPIGGNGQAPIVASLLLPDILVYDPTSNAGFFGDTVGTLGQPNFFLAGGRKLSDDVISTEVSILTDPDTPFNLDGGADQLPLVGTQNVADDNGLNLTDGSIVGPGTTLAGQTRTAAFPYIGARNPNPSNVPGGNPPA